MKAVLGGSFSILHKGHKALIQKAFEVGDSVILGLTTDEYAKKHKIYKVSSYVKREKALKKYMDSFNKPYVIKPLDTREGGLTSSPDLDILVVSQETAGNISGINEIRRQNGLKPLAIKVVPLVLAEDLFPISSTRINRREIRKNGNRILPVRISISTGNDLKVEAARDSIKKIMKNFTIEKFSKYSLETDQPFGVDTERLATSRAMAGLRDNDYSIGVESGIFYNSFNNIYYDVHAATIIDRQSRLTIGYSSGFEIPSDIIALIKRGNSEGDAFSKIYGITVNEMKNGIIGKISEDMLTRQELVSEAIRNAIIPRLAPSYYHEEWDSHYNP
ncbi:pantetheine-phosphate adenylyltransferase [Oxyplasma meridianum]|uniref:Phosphopantetheine adenylyltransferase n=1 Tax=Oxyplasma meridianum TaxID=3073602 RepID=A0AAX4NH95_9ARCH